MKLTLAYCPTACSLVPYILLTEAGADFDTLPVNLGKGENNRPDYLRINPKGKVPALMIDGDVLTENVAIQHWIAQQYPQARLMPLKPLAHAKALAVMAWCASGMHPKLTQQARPARFCSQAEWADDVRALGSEALFKEFAVADAMLAGREWFFDQFSCADAYFYWCFRRGAHFKPDLTGFTHCLKHRQRMEQRASVRKLLAFESHVLAQFAAAV